MGERKCWYLTAKGLKIGDGERKWLYLTAERFSSPISDGGTGEVVVPHS